MVEGGSIEDIDNAHDIYFQDLELQKLAPS